MESKIRDLRQEIFKFEQLSNFDKNDFFISECNYFAFNLIKSWPNWEKKILNIYGERKSGKSHLSEIFLENEKGIKLKFKELNEKIFDKIKGYQNIVIEDFNERFGSKLSDNGVETLGGFLINKFEKVPKKQESHQVNNFLFTVLSADSKKINRIQLIIKNKES